MGDSGAIPAEPRAARIALQCRTRRPSLPLKLIIQIPARNEESTIERTLRDLPRRIPGIDVIETLLIDDGSTDETVAVARRAGVTHVVSLLSHKGLATAFSTGIDEALRRGADVIVNTDADNQYRGSDIEKIVRPVIDEGADVVVGDRDMRANPHMSGGKRFLQRVGSLTVSLASGVSIPDVTSGFRAFSREAAWRINVFNPFTYTLETLIQAGNRNLRVVSVPVSTNPPTRSSRLHRGNLHYLRKSVVTIFRIHTLYKPLKTFSLLGGLLVAGGVALGLRFLWYWATEGTAGHVQSLILAAILSIVGFQTILIGLLADLISVNRRLGEDMLVRLRKIESGGERRHRRSRPRGERAASPEEGERPIPGVEPQWVWLVDEARLDAAGVTLESQDEPVAERDSRAAGRRRRKRRRSPRETPPSREPLPHHDPPVDSGD